MHILVKVNDCQFKFVQTGKLIQKKDYFKISLADSRQPNTSLENITNCDMRLCEGTSHELFSLMLWYNINNLQKYLSVILVVLEQAGLHFLQYK